MKVLTYWRVDYNMFYNANPQSAEYIQNITVLTTTKEKARELAHNYLLAKESLYNGLCSEKFTMIENHVLVDEEVYTTYDPDDLARIA